MLISLLTLFLITCHGAALGISGERINPRYDNYRGRVFAAYHSTVAQDIYDLAAEHNGDDAHVASYAGSFHKTLTHDATTGLLTAGHGQPNYKQLLHALQTAQQEDFNAIQRATEATRKFVNPQGAYALSLIGVPCALIPMPSAWNLTSAEAAAEMIEVYLKAICRDVFFHEWGTGTGTDKDTLHGGSITANAAAVLTALGDAFKGPKINSTVTVETLFRGLSDGDLVGPYISQFWYLPIHKHFQNVPEEQVVPVAQTREFGIAWDDFVAIQNGAVPTPYANTDFDGTRYIVNTKNAATVVHNDAPGAFFFDAVNILLYNGFPLAKNLPYNNGSITNEAPFVTMHIADICAALFTASQEGLKHAWGHKWLANRRLRPEAMAGLVHQAKVTDQNTLNLHDSLFADYQNINVLTWIQARNKAHRGSVSLSDASTYLLPLVYPEGSPTHPSYPAGHAVIAGACATIVKAFFADEERIVDYIAPVKPNPNDPTELVALPNTEDAHMLTVGGELDKLASNIAIARNHAGVHYRSDGEDGILLGEQVALKLLQDWTCIYHEQGFTGFELTLRNGQRVRVTLDAIEVIA